MKAGVIKVCIFSVVFLINQPVALAGSNKVKAVSGNSKVKDMEKHRRIDEVFSKTKPICFTRFVIDVPNNSAIVFGRMTLDAEIKRFPEVAYDINGFILRQIDRGKKNALMFGRGSEIDKLAGRPLYTKNERLTHVVSIIGHDKYALDSFLVLGNDIYILGDKGVLGSEIHKFMQYNENTASALQSLPDNGVPEQAGVCIDGAFTSKNPEYENIEFGVRLAEFPDVHLSISLIKHGDYAEPQEEFLNRHAEALERGRNAGFGKWIENLRYLRKGPRKLNDWLGDEILIKFPAWKENKSGHQFAFWSTGKPNDPLHPRVDIRLDTGVKGNTLLGVPASLTDEEAIMLWERLLSSIRVRPLKADNGKSSIGLPSDVSDIGIGTERCSDSICPASGWWQCFSADAVEPMRWFAQGEKLPRVRYRKEETWREKLFDTPRTVLGSGIWQLMRHDERARLAPTGDGTKSL